VNLRSVAKLARLKLSDDELGQFSTQLSAIIEHFSDLNSVQTEGVLPMLTPIKVEFHWREDQARTSMSSEEALAGAPDRQGQLFKVPPVI
jgi:aspartyl-tRNA(Asn)/glutamyl-tRNA(Gln) amidotransferase subunit C